MDDDWFVLPFNAIRNGIFQTDKVGFDHGLDSCEIHSVPRKLDDNNVPTL
jgi:hypothetical protein